MKTPHQIGVVGAGIMGQGIAQVMAQSGLTVRLFDVADGAAEAAKTSIGDALTRRVKKGRLSEDDREATLRRLHPVGQLSDLAESDLVIEAVVERLDVKHRLFQELEAIASRDTLLCTNTSSLSVRDIAAGLDDPQRLFGLHFFNPAPVMALVEVVHTPHSDPTLLNGLINWVPTLGKIPVAVADSPGFIVNRCARPFYSEALTMLDQALASPAVIDDALTANLGVPLGPFALMDLVGLDVNLAATESLWQAFEKHPRFKPSAAVRDRVANAHLGRKTGQGFYRHPRPAPETEVTTDLSGSEELAKHLEAALEHPVRVSDGQTIDTLEQSLNRPVLMLDQSFIDWTGRSVTLGYTTSADLGEDLCRQAEALAADHGIRLVTLPDTPGLLAQRLVMMLYDEAERAVQQGVAAADDIDTALKRGLNFALGPFELARQLTDPARERIRSRLAAGDATGRYRDDPAGDVRQTDPSD